MPSFNIEKIDFKVNCGISEEKVCNIIEDSFPKGDEILYKDVADNVYKKLEKLGHQFNVIVSNLTDEKLQVSFALFSIYSQKMEFKVSYCGKFNWGQHSRDTRGNTYLVKIWK